ncbi:hypothetical protein [Klebsiella pneumoniae]|uniref:hypothetical protein n=1 Tax=Klebsiella pneumoniae TaxID=573 RepID=UPI00388D31B4
MIFSKGQSDPPKNSLQWDEMIRTALAHEAGQSTGFSAGPFIAEKVNVLRTLTQAIIEVGRINKTAVSLLNYIDEDYRRRILDPA